MHLFRTRLSTMRPDTAMVAYADSSEKNVSNPTAHTSLHKGLLSTWLTALWAVLPLYIGVHLAFIVTTAFSFLFIFRDFSWQNMRMQQLWNAWHRGDTGSYMSIARHGYDVAWRTVFFPLYPVLERGVAHFFRDLLLGGLIASNVAGLIMLVTLYQLVQEDFDQQRAWRTTLYLSVFPAAFLFAAAYNESLFLCLTLLSFYCIRHGQWWLAGLCGLFASVTCPAGVVLLVPFCYEYLRQHKPRLGAVRLDALSVLLVPSGLALFSLYCFVRFHDAFAFFHAGSNWNTFQIWYQALSTSHGLLSFQMLYTLIDLLLDVLLLSTIVLGFIGVWRFPRRLWAYGFYAIALFLFVHVFPVESSIGNVPLQSFGRNLLAIFPAFITMAALGKYRMFNMNYVLISGSVLFFLLTQFLLAR